MGVANGVSYVISRAETNDVRGTLAPFVSIVADASLAGIPTESEWRSTV